MLVVPCADSALTQVARSTRVRDTTQRGTRRMTLTQVKLKRFTAFSDLSIDLSPGINVFVGANGTGKTHLMKVCYVACEASRPDVHFMEKLVRVFLPSGRRPGRLVKRQVGLSKASVEVRRGDRKLTASFSTKIKRAHSEEVEVTGLRDWTKDPIKSAYIPVKEMLANAPGFRSLYEARETHFEEVYQDILHRAYLPILRGPRDEQRNLLLPQLERELGGSVFVQNEEFFLHNKQGNLEFSLLAEGIRKLALLWLLIQNGVLTGGSVLFWDEPETNLNPKLFGVVMDILLELQRAGVQVFIATHDYVILEEIDLRRTDEDSVAFHTLHLEGGEISCSTAGDYLGIRPNAIAEAFDDLYDREIKRSLRGLVK